MIPAIVVLGGYGNFGRRIVETLVADRTCRVFVAGRSLAVATIAAAALGDRAEALATDCQSPTFVDELRRLKPLLVIHTAGPFQGQSYDVAQACIEAGTHYIDLADGRAFVCGIGKLDALAHERGVLAVAGASSLPALSSAVVDRLAVHFDRIDSIEHAITSGAKPPGEATMRGVLGYAGHRFDTWFDGAWVESHGWHDIERLRFRAPIGTRWIARCDVPDLELFPARYPTVRTVTFKAGVGTSAGMFALWTGAHLVRLQAMKSLVPHVSWLHRAARAIEPWGTKCSAMQVAVRGLDTHGESSTRIWTLIARNDHGPQIPCFPAIALARKLLRNEVAIRGATPCMGLLDVDEIIEVGAGLELETFETVLG